MQRTILDVAVQEGEEVEQGDVLLVLEAMKMENDIVAPRAGTISDVRVLAGTSVDTGDTLVVIE